MTTNSVGSTLLAEMKEFAGFSKGTQRYIRRSLLVGLGRPQDALDLYSRDIAETAAIRAQASLYADRLPFLRNNIPDDTGILECEAMMSPLVLLSTFDLGQDRIPGFGPYRFLYERLIGAEMRPWLPSAFCAAAALPGIHPDKRRSLLQSISENAATAPGWSRREPVFFPEWVEKVEPLAA
jgi:hypothetical protein